jgi:hypothetical protein
MAATAELVYQVSEQLVSRRYKSKASNAVRNYHAEQKQDSGVKHTQESPQNVNTMSLAHYSSFFGLRKLLAA